MKTLFLMFCCLLMVAHAALAAEAQVYIYILPFEPLNVSNDTILTAPAPSFLDVHLASLEARGYDDCTARNVSSVQSMITCQYLVRFGFLSFTRRARFLLDDAGNLEECRSWWTP